MLHFSPLKIALTLVVVIGSLLFALPLLLLYEVGYAGAQGRVAAVQRLDAQPGVHAPTWAIQSLRL